MLTALAEIAVLTYDENQSGKYNFELEDYSAAQSMLLAAVLLGYASLWLDSPYFDGAKQRKAKRSGRL